MNNIYLLRGEHKKDYFFFIGFFYTTRIENQLSFRYKCENNSLSFLAWLNGIIANSDTNGIVATNQFLNNCAQCFLPF